MLVGYGEAVVAPLAYFMRDREEDIWIRRHVPSTLALLPFPASVEALTRRARRYGRVPALQGDDGARSAAARPSGRCAIDPKIVTRHINAEAARAFNALTLHYNLFVAGGLDTQQPAGARADRETRARAEPHLQPARPDPVAERRRRGAACAQRPRRARAIARASSILDNLLEGDVRKRVMLLVDEMPAEERIRKGNVIYRTRTRDVEDTVAQLLHDEDQSIASAAVLLVEERGLWSLADDLEHVLAHRDVRDQDVFEAASWALAANRVKAERRKQLWQEPLPAVELADRLRQRAAVRLHARRRAVPAGAARAARSATRQGRALYERGERCTSIQFLLDGRVTVARRRREAGRARRRRRSASRSCSKARRCASTITAAEPAITLSLTADEFLALLSENVELAEGIFRMLIESHGLGTGPHADSRHARRRT